MNRRLVLLIAALSFVGCSEDEVSNATPVEDAGFDGETSTPITERPDDGVDTSVATDSATTDSGVADSGAADTGAPDTRPGADAIPDTPAGDAPAGVTVVQVGGLGGISFDPATVNIKVGDTVRWVWVGTGHNVVSGTTCTADNKFCSPTDMSCATAPTSGVGTTYEHKFTTAGAYPYFCKPHCTAGMIGTVNVAP